MRWDFLKADGKIQLSVTSEQEDIQNLVIRKIKDAIKGVGRK